MAVRISPDPRMQFFDNQGNVLAGGLLFSYAAGSTTKQNTYTTSTGAVANSNPIVLDSAGRTPSGVWFTEGLLYKLVLAPANDTDPPTSPIWSEDNLRGVNDTALTIDQWVASGVTPTYVSATSFTLVGDQTQAFHIGRRLKTTNTAGTIYSRISNSVFGALTTVTVVNDSGTLDSGLSAVSYGLLTATNPSFPAIIDGGAGITITYPSGRPTVTSSAVGTVPRILQNVGLTVTMAANAVTIALTDAALAAPSASSPVVVGFRNATITSGASSQVSVVAALSTVISSGSTAGFVNATAGRIWVGGLLTGGAVELCWYNARSGTTIAPINEGGLISTTAEGGAGGADSAQVWYSTTARSNVPVTIIGYFDATEATAGTWATAASAIVVNPKYRPGDTVQIQRNATGAVATGTTVVPTDDTIPQNTEGDQYMSQAITPSAAANLLRIEVQGNYGVSVAANDLAQCIFQDAVANALAVSVGNTSSSTIRPTASPYTQHSMVAATTSSTTFKMRCGSTAAGTTTFNGTGGGRIYGGVMASWMQVTEIVA